MVKKKVKKKYKNNFKGMAQAAGMSGGAMGHEEKKPAMVQGFGAGIRHEDKAEKERAPLNSRIAVGQQMSSHDAFAGKTSVASDSASTTTTITKTVKKLNLSDFATVLKDLTGEEIESNQLESLVKKYTGGDLSLGNISKLIGFITGKDIDLSNIGEAIKKVTGEEVSESDLAETKAKSSFGGIIVIIVIGVIIYALTKMF